MLKTAICAFEAIFFVGDYFTVFFILDNKRLIKQFHP